MAEEIQSNIRVNIDTASALAGLKLLQREISAFHTQMSKAGAASAATSAQMGSNLVNTINQTGKFAASMTTVKTSAQAFTTALEKNQLTMGQYFKYAAGASKSFGSKFATEFNTINNVAIERVKSLQTQYVKMGTAANGAISAIKVRPLTLDMEHLGTRTMIAAQRQQLLNQMLDLGSTKLLNFGKNMQWAGRQLMVGFTVPLTMFAGAAMNSYKQIEAERIQLTRVYGTFETTAAQANAAADSIQKLALQYTAYGVAVKDTMALGATVAAAGATGKDLTEQVAASSKLAVLGRMSQDEAFKSIMVLKNAFHLSGKGLENTVGLMNAVQNQTVNSIQDITEATIKAGPVVQALGGNMSDLLFFTTAMREGGISASQGANALKSALASMINPTTKAQTLLKGMGIDLQAIVQKDKGNLRATVMDFGAALDKLDPLKRAQALETLFGKFQFARVSALFNNINRAGSQAQSVAGLGGASSKQLEDLMNREMKKVSDSPLYKFQKQLADFQAAIAPIGEQFMKFLTPIMKFFTDLAKGFEKLPDGMKTAIVGIAVILGGVAPLVLMLVGLISNGAANMMKFLVTIKKFFNGLTSGSKVLGEQVRYMSQQEIDAAAEAASLDQVHQKLVQTFTVEREAVDLLSAAYERAAIAARGFGPMPSVAKATAAEASVIRGYSASAINVTRGIQGYAEGGILKGPGTGTSDSMVARVSTGEAIIPAASVKKNPDVVNSLISGDMPAYATGGIVGQFESGYKSEAKLAYEAEQRRLAEARANDPKIKAEREAAAKARMPKLFLYDSAIAGPLTPESPVAHKMVIDQNLGKLGFVTFKNDIQFTQDPQHTLMRNMGMRANRWRTVKPGDNSWLGKYFDVNEYGPLGNIIRRFAEGGIVNGPGTGTSDSVVARVSNGEAIIPADSVKKNPDVVSALVSGDMPAYSEGIAAIGGKGTDNRYTQFTRTDAMQQGHLEEGTRLSINQILENVSEVTTLTEKDLQAIKNKYTRLKEEIMKDLKLTEQQALDYKLSAFNEKTYGQSPAGNNRGASENSPGRPINVAAEAAYYKNSGGHSGSNFARHMENVGMADSEIKTILEKTNGIIVAELEKLPEGAQIIGSELDTIIDKAMETAVVGETKAAEALSNMEKSYYTLAYGPRTNDRRVMFGGERGSYDATSNRARGLAITERVLGSASPYPEKGQIHLDPTKFAAANAAFSTGAVKEGLLQLKAAGGEFEAIANKAAGLIGKDSEGINEGIDLVDKALIRLQEETMGLANTADGTSERLAQGINEATGAASPSKKAIEIAGKNIGDGALLGIEEGLSGTQVAVATAMEEVGATVKTNTMSWSEWQAALNGASASLDVATADQILYEEIMNQLSAAKKLEIPTAETITEKIQLMTLAGGEFGDIAQKASAQYERGGSGVELGTNMANEAFDKYVAKVQAQIAAQEELSNMATLDAEALQKFIAEFGTFNSVVSAVNSGTSQAMSKAKNANDPSMYKTVTSRGEQLGSYIHNNAPVDEMDESPRTQAPRFVQATASASMPAAPITAAAEGTVVTFAEAVQTESKVVIPEATGTMMEEIVSTVQASIPRVAEAANMLTAEISKPIIASAPNISKASQRILAPLMNPEAEVTMQRLNEALIQNVKIVNDDVLENSANNIALREGAQMLKIANAPMNAFWGAVDKIGLAAENVGPMLTSASEKIQVEFIKMQERVEVLATTAVEAGTKFGIAAKELAIAGIEATKAGAVAAGTAVRNGAVATGNFVTSPHSNKLSDSLRNKQTALQNGQRGGGGTGMMATMGLSMVAGMASGIEGPVGKFASALQPAIMALSVLSMITPMLSAEFMAAAAGIAAALIEFIVPIMAVVAVIALVVAAFMFVADQAEKDAERTAAANRKAAEGVIGFGNALTLSKDQLGNFNDTFSANVGPSAVSSSKLTSGPSGYSSTIQSSENSQKSTKLANDKDFKSVNSNLLSQLKSAKGAQGDLLINTFAQTLKSQGAAEADITTYVEALKEAAGRKDLNLNFKSIDISSPAGQIQMEQQIKAAAGSFKYLQKKYSPEVLAKGETIANNAASVQGLTAKSYIANIKKIGTTDETSGEREDYRNSVIDQLRNNTDFQDYIGTHYGQKKVTAWNSRTAEQRKDALKGVSFDDQIKQFKKDAAGNNNDSNSEFAMMIKSVEKTSNAAETAFTSSKSGGMSAGDLAMLHTQAQLVGQDVVNMGTAFKNGQMSSKDFNKQMKMIGENVKSLGAVQGKNFVDSIVDSMKGLDPKVKTIIKSLTNVKDEMLLIKAASLGINVNESDANKIKEGEDAEKQLKANPKMSGQGLAILQNKVTAKDDILGALSDSITSYMADITKATEAAKSSLDKLNEKYQKQSDLYNAEGTLLQKVQDKISSAYKKRIDALTTISKINDAIAQSQKDQLGLATALSQGDIAQAANAAQTMRANQAKNAIEQQQAALQAQSDRAVAAATITYKGKKINQAQLDAAKEKADVANLLANNKGLGYSVGGVVGYATGGMVAPKYFAAGDLARGTDIIPAMLTPGEFVMTKSTVDRLGSSNLSALNSGASLNSDSEGEGSVYNYSVNVNVATGANPEEIANTVMRKFQQVNSQNLRGNTYGA
ncbi:Phage tail tape measure protein [uncultured Caudovirales phage]|uniref:Phage tail tape measure protein n=1 Tax=uncultured Caudovirales phage TaxID=2100421 RepID=A0A6J7WMA2_9CAUD|nr:Phage tail tape measure protein [uncultured Caudovirales phage]CAB5219229.1 Phage tail tape measure protein [uncultured Caudovirales phage]